jgi:hypothetical protein
VTVWIGDEFSVQGTVGADGTITLSAPIPESLKAGLHTLRIDATEADGSAATFLVGIEIVDADEVLDVEAAAAGKKKSKSGVSALAPLGSKSQSASGAAATGIDMSGSLLLVLLLEILGILGLAVVRLRRNGSPLR